MPGTATGASCYPDHWYPLRRRKDAVYKQLKFFVLMKNQCYRQEPPFWRGVSQFTMLIFLAEILVHDWFSCSEQLKQGQRAG